MPTEPVSRWIVTDASRTFVGRAAIVDAENEQDAATEGLLWLDEYRESDEDLMSMVRVAPFGGAVCYRADMVAERVPDEFQCCGGMPRLDGIGTRDEHTGPCAKRACALTSDDSNDQEGGSRDGS